MSGGHLRICQRDVNFLSNDVALNRTPTTTKSNPNPQSPGPAPPSPCLRRPTARIAPPWRLKMQAISIKARSPPKTLPLARKRPRVHDGGTTHARGANTTACVPGIHQPPGVSLSKHPPSSPSLIHPPIARPPRGGRQHYRHSTAFALTLNDRVLPPPATFRRPPARQTPGRGNPGGEEAGGRDRDPHDRHGQRRGHEQLSEQHERQRARSRRGHVRQECQARKVRPGQDRHEQHGQGLRERRRARESERERASERTSTRTNEREASEDGTRGALVRL